MSKILVIGASGLVGSNCYAYLKSIGYDVIGTHRNFAAAESIYFDPLLSTEKELQSLIQQEDLVAIVYTAGLTFVDYCEKNTEESYQNNVAGISKFLPFVKKETKFIYISTDYIFDGKNGPYFENDTPNPVNVYGKHKNQAENLIRLNIQNHLILRVTNVYGNEIRQKNFISRLIIQLKENNTAELQLPFDQLATPVNAKDIARSIASLLSNNSSGIYHIASTDLITRYHLGIRVQSYFHNSKLKITPIKTSNMNIITKRPLLGGLLAYKFLIEFPDFSFTNVDDFIKSQV